MANGTFGTAINCMDGRTQEPVANYIKENYGVDYVDAVNLAGPNKVLAEQKKKSIIENVQFRLNVSVNGHGSKVIAIVGHDDCGGNPDASKEQQYIEVEKSMELVKSWFPEVEVLGLFVNSKLEVERIK